ncbi:MAG: hypothetical protein ABEJ72_10165 [Candidatus Aenigmatarchaeota archaeon]
MESTAITYFGQSAFDGVRIDSSLGVLSRLSDIGISFLITLAVILPL